MSAIRKAALPCSASACLTCWIHAELAELLGAVSSDHRGSEDLVLWCPVALVEGEIGQDYVVPIRFGLGETVPRRIDMGFDTSNGDVHEGDLRSLGVPIPSPQGHVRVESYAITDVAVGLDQQPT